jgi:hypothetical protein
MEKLMKRITSVGLPVAALAVALSAGDVRAQSNPWSVSFDLGTQVSLNGVVLSNVNMYDTSVVPSVGAGGGVQINLSDRVAVQGGVEFRWQGDATDLDGLAGTGLESINDESRRWSIPITGGITVRF